MRRKKKNKDIQTFDVYPHLSEYQYLTGPPDVKSKGGMAYTYDDYLTNSMFADGGTVTPSWDCDGEGNCTDPGTGAGAYTTEAACKAACKPDVTKQEKKYNLDSDNPDNLETGYPNYGIPASLTAGTALGAFADIFGGTKTMLGGVKDAFTNINPATGLPYTKLDYAKSTINNITDENMLVDFQSWKDNKVIDKWGNINEDANTVENVFISQQNAEKEYFNKAAKQHSEKFLDKDENSILSRKVMNDDGSISYADIEYEEAVSVRNPAYDNAIGLVPLDWEGDPKDHPSMQNIPEFNEEMQTKTRLFTEDDLTKGDIFQDKVKDYNVQTFDTDIETGEVTKLTRYDDKGQPIIEDYDSEKDYREGYRKKSVGGGFPRNNLAAFIYGGSLPKFQDKGETGQYFPMYGALNQEGYSGPTYKQSMGRVVPKVDASGNPILSEDFQIPFKKEDYWETELVNYHDPKMAYWMDQPNYAEGRTDVNMNVDAEDMLQKNYWDAERVAYKKSRKEGTDDAIDKFEDVWGRSGSTYARKNMPTDMSRAAQMYRGEDYTDDFNTQVGPLKPDGTFRYGGDLYYNDGGQPSAEEMNRRKLELHNAMTTPNSEAPNFNLNNWRDVKNPDLWNALTIGAGTFLGSAGLRNMSTNKKQNRAYEDSYNMYMDQQGGADAFLENFDNLYCVDGTCPLVQNNLANMVGDHDRPDIEWWKDPNTGQGSINNWTDYYKNAHGVQSNEDIRSQKNSNLLKGGRDALIAGGGSYLLNKLMDTNWGQSLQDKIGMNIKLGIFNEQGGELPKAHDGIDMGAHHPHTPSNPDPDAGGNESAEENKVFKDEDGLIITEEEYNRRLNNEGNVDPLEPLNTDVVSQEGDKYYKTDLNGVRTEITKEEFDAAQGALNNNPEGLIDPNTGKPFVTQPPVPNLPEGTKPLETSFGDTLGQEVWNEGSALMNTGIPGFAKNLWRTTGAGATKIGQGINTLATLQENADNEVITHGMGDESMDIMSTIEPTRGDRGDFDVNSGVYRADTLGKGDGVWGQIAQMGAEMGAPPPDYTYLKQFLDNTIVGYDPEILMMQAQNGGTVMEANMELIKQLIAAGADFEML